MAHTMALLSPPVHTLSIYINYQTVNHSSSHTKKIPMTNMSIDTKFSLMYLDLDLFFSFGLLGCITTWSFFGDGLVLIVWKFLTESLLELFIRFSASFWAFKSSIAILSRLSSLLYSSFGNSMICLVDYLQLEGAECFPLLICLCFGELSIMRKSYTSPFPSRRVSRVCGSSWSLS